MHVCLCLCSRWLSDAWSLLFPHEPHTKQSFPPPPHLSVSTLQCTEGEEWNFSLAVSKPCPLQALVLPSASPLRWLNHFSGLILLKTICCVTSPWQEAARREWYSSGEIGLSGLCKVKSSEKHSGRPVERGGRGWKQRRLIFFSFFFPRLIPTWIIREANEGYTLKGILM